KRFRPTGRPSTQRNEGKWFPRKNWVGRLSAQCRCFLLRQSRPEGRRKSGSLEKSAAVPLRTRLPWLPLGERARPGGMRKSGSFEKSIAPLVEPDSWTSV